MTVPGKTLRWAMARFSLLWGFYRSTPASVGTPRRPCIANRCQRPSIRGAAPHVNRSVAHAHASSGSTATPARRGVQHTPPKAHEQKLSRSDLVQPWIHMSFCSDKPIMAGFLGSFVPYSVSTLAGRHDDRDLISLTAVRRQLSQKRGAP